MKSNKYDLSTLDVFFECDVWENICTQALDEDNEHAHELMMMLSLMFDSFYFFLENNIHDRAKRELLNLNKLVNHLTETL